jgi:hypothetical protein
MPHIIIELYYSTFVSFSVALEMTTPSFNIIRFLHNQKNTLKYLVNVYFTLEQATKTE